MAVALGWIALALAGVVGAPRAERGDAEIGYTVRFVETEGLGWRAAVFTRLTPVTRQGAATVWTAPRGVAQRLVDTALKDRTSRVLRAPKVTARNGSPVHIAARSNQQLVTQVAWGGDDPSTAGKPETVPPARPRPWRGARSIKVSSSSSSSRIRRSAQSIMSTYPAPRACPAPVTARARARRRPER